MTYICMVQLLQTYVTLFFLSCKVLYVCIRYNEVSIGEATEWNKEIACERDCMR